MLDLKTLSSMPMPLNAEELTEELKRKFYYEFGVFICAYSNVERVSHSLFLRISGLKENAARAIINGTDLSKLMEIIKALSIQLPNKKLSAINKQEIEFLFQQVSSINPLRNSLIHGGVDFDNGIIRTTNSNKAKSKETIKEINLELKDLQCATYDLGIIGLRLYHLVHRDSWSRKNISYLRKHAWLYKALPVKDRWSRLLADELLRHPRPPTPPN